MHRSAAAAGSAVFFVAAPGTVVGLVPWLITHWELPDSSAVWRVAQVMGALLIVAGLVPVVHAFMQFVRAGGTPMPLAPPPRLVVTGFNRYVRNPMYVGVLVSLAGQAMLFGSLGVLVFAAAAWICTAAFVRWYEEPDLTRRYGSQYQEYRRNVPAWFPRPRPWAPPQRETATPRREA